MRTTVALDLSCDTDFERWQAYVLARPDTHYTDLGQWRRIFAELYGMRNVTFACIEDEKTLGVVSLYLIASPFFGRLLVTCPFIGRGGLYADDDSVRDALLEAVHGAAVELGVEFVEFRLQHPLGDPYRVSSDFVEFELPLGEDAEQTWSRSLTSNARQNVRKSKTFPLTFSTTRDPRGPYALLSRNIRDLGTPFHPSRYFDLMLEHLGRDVQFCQVHLQDRLVAAGVLVRFKDRLSTPYIGSLKRYGSTRANYCQYWGIIRHCIDAGVRCFDLGRSPRGTSVASFKKKWGAAAVEMQYSHRAFSTRRSYRTVLEPSRAETLVSEVWKKLPLALTRRVGSWAARYIP